MTFEIRLRTAWQTPSQPVTGPPYPTSSIVEVLYHYPGGGATADYTDPVRTLRAMQADYLRNRGYSLGYSYVIDLTGVVWQVRGVDIRPAATAGYNDKGVAVQFLVPGVQPANAAQVDTAVDLHRWLETRHGRTLGAAGHYQRGTTATPCPGAGIKPQIPGIERRAHQTPPAPLPPYIPLPSDDDEDDMTFIAQRSDGANALVSHGGAGVCLTWLDGTGGFTTAGIPTVRVTDAEFDRLIAQNADSQRRLVTADPSPFPVHLI